MTDPDCAPESVKYVSTFRTGSHARDGILLLGKTLLVYFLFLGFIACLNLPIPKNEIRVATNA